MLSGRVRLQGTKYRQSAFNRHPWCSNATKLQTQLTTSPERKEVRIDIASRGHGPYYHPSRLEITLITCYRIDAHTINMPVKLSSLSSDAAFISRHDRNAFGSKMHNCLSSAQRALTLAPSAPCQNAPGRTNFHKTPMTMHTQRTTDAQPASPPSVQRAAKFKLFWLLGPNNNVFWAQTKSLVSQFAPVCRVQGSTVHLPFPKAPLLAGVRSRDPK